MKLRISGWLPLLLVLLLAMLTLWLRVVVESREEAGGARGRHDPDAVVDNFKVMRLNEQGAPQYLLSASRMIHYGDDDSTDLEAPQILRPGEGAAITIRAARGSVTHDGQEAFFRDRVQIVREATADRAELRIQTDYLHVLPDQKIARTHRPVTISEGRTLLSGVGMEFDEQARQFRVHSKVKATFERRRD